MAVTWTAAAPHRDAVSRIGAQTISGISAPVPWAGNKRAIVTKLTASGTYSTGGDTVTAASLGLASVDAAFVLSDSDTDIDIVPANATDAGGVPLFVLTDPANPKIKLVDKTAELTAADTVTNYEFHVLLIGT